MRRDFHAVRLSRAGVVPSGTPHLVVYCNHPSWWDAAVIVIVLARLFAGRAGFAPINAAMAARYGFMTRIGAIGVVQNARSGAAAFLEAARAILAQPSNLLFVTAEGRFTDARVRPTVLAPGLAHLPDLCAQATFVPMALDYVFWDERKPEVLLRFGPPIAASALIGLGRADRARRLAQALEAVMDDLAREAIARDATAFTPLIAGRAGVGGVYDLWRRARAMMRGQRFVAHHGDPS